jgi:hypothetical protein
MTSAHHKAHREDKPSQNFNKPRVRCCERGRTAGYDIRQETAKRKHDTGKELCPRCKSRDCESVTNAYGFDEYFVQTGAVLLDGRLYEGNGNFGRL